MTREEAYKKWVAAGQDFCYTNIDLWNAACDWQLADCRRLYEQMHWSEGYPDWEYIMSEDK